MSFYLSVVKLFDNIDGYLTVCWCASRISFNTFLNTSGGTVGKERAVTQNNNYDTRD